MKCKSIKAVDMENLNVNGVYAKVELNHNGSFVQHPFSYANGFTLTIDDHDFVGMDYSKCVTWLDVTSRVFRYFKISPLVLNYVTLFLGL